MAMSLQYLVYLVGPVTGISYDEAMGWRRHVMERFPDNIVAVSPLRSQRYLENKKRLHSSYDNEHPFSSGKGIVSRDWLDVGRCDAILVYFLNANHVSIGSIVEVAWAYAQRKPIIVVMENEGNVHDHAMIREMATHVVPTLEEATGLIIRILKTI